MMPGVPRTLRQVQCPRCGHKFGVTGRARIGQGTQRGKRLKVLNRNKQRILTLLRQEYPRALSIREIQGALYRRKIMRFQRGDTKVPTGSWNYHLVQADVSLLLGAGFIEMQRRPREKFERGQEQRITARPVPLYAATSEGLGLDQEIPE